MQNTPRFNTHTPRTSTSTPGGRSRENSLDQAKPGVPLLALSRLAKAPNLQDGQSAQYQVSARSHRGVTPRSRLNPPTSNTPRFDQDAARVALREAVMQHRSNPHTPRSGHTPRDSIALLEVGQA